MNRPDVLYPSGHIEKEVYCIGYWTVTDLSEAIAKWWSDEEGVNMSKADIEAISEAEIKAQAEQTLTLAQIEYENSGDFPSYAVLFGLWYDKVVCS